MTTYQDLEYRDSGGNKTVFNKNTGVGYQDPTALAADLGVQAPDINWGAITAKSLEPAQAINLPDTPQDNTNYQGIIAGSSALTDLTKTDAPTDDWFSKFLSSTPEPPSGAEQFTNIYGTGPTQEEVSTLDKNRITANAAVTSSRNEFNAINAQLQALNLESQATQEQLQKDATGRGITAGGLQPHQTAALRDIALRSLPLQGQALIAQGKIYAAQNDANTAQLLYDSAQKKFDKIFDLRMTDIENQYNYKKELRDRVYDYMTVKEQRQIDAMNKADDRKYQESRDNLNLAQQWVTNAINNGQGDVAAKISALDPKDPQFMEKLGALQGQVKVNEEKAVVTDLLTKYPDAGISLNDTLATAQSKLGNSKIYREQVRGPVGAASSGTWIDITDANGKIIGQRNSKTGEVNSVNLGGKPLEILDIQRYKEAYPEAGIESGDTEESANVKIAAVTQPRDFTDEEIRQMIRDDKDTNNSSYEQVITAIEDYPTLKNKERARLIADELYGKTGQQGENIFDKISNFIFGK